MVSLPNNVLERLSCLNMRGTLGRGCGADSDRHEVLEMKRGEHEQLLQHRARVYRHETHGVCVGCAEKREDWN